MAETDTETGTEAVKPAGTRRGKSRLNIEELTLEEVTALTRELENRRQVLVRENRSRLAREVTEWLRKEGVTLEDLFPARAGRSGQAGKNQPAATRRKVAPKYRGPNGQEWTGQGFTPTWLRELEEAGRDRTEFLINPEPPDEQAAG